MRGRAAVYHALSTSEKLAEAGCSDVMPNFGFDNPPRKPFLILKFGTNNVRSGGIRGPRTFDIWAHVPVSVSRDFDDVDAILEAAISELTSMVQYEYGGERVTCIRYTGSGSDQEDTGYNTITRNAGFEILA